MNKAVSPIIVALDFPDRRSASELVARVEPGLCALKVGKELFTREGPGFVGELVKKGFPVFLDLKYHDIPNTVARACAAAADLGVWMINVHASGGRRMMEAASETLNRRPERPLLVAVTILTSLTDEEIREIGFQGGAKDNVLRLSELALQSGVDGVVCSPWEASAVRQATSPGFKLVTPGVRFEAAARDDQRRVMTPSAALDQGADYLVIGRPVTAAVDPLERLRAVWEEIGRHSN